MLGTVAVISSGGEAYERMAAAWLVSWRLQHRPGYRLVLLHGGPDDQNSIVPLEAPDAFRAVLACPETLIPGVLDKTIAFLNQLHAGGGWVYRTNLSSYVDLGRLIREMDGLPPQGILGYAPGRDHLCGAGLGLSERAVDVLKSHEHLLDRSVIDDVAMSGLLFSLGCTVVWTGRMDRVYPDGLVCHNRPAQHQYHVRLKTQDRLADADVLMALAAEGIGLAEAWFPPEQSLTPNTWSTCSS